MDNPELEATYELLKEVVRKKGIHFSGNLSEELEPLSKKTLITVEAFKEVLKKIARELLDEQFGK